MKTDVLKPLPHYERIRTNCAPVISLPCRPIIRKQRVNTFDENTGLMSTKVKYVTIDRKAEMKPFRVSDFSLDNLLAIGAKLDSAQLTASPLAQVANMEKTLSNLNFE